MLHPDLSAYKPTSIGEANKMYDIGYECAIKHIPQILKDIENLSLKKSKKPKK